MLTPATLANTTSERGCVAGHTLFLLLPGGLATLAAPALALPKRQRRVLQLSCWGTLGLAGTGRVRRGSKSCVAGRFGRWRRWHRRGHRHPPTCSPMVSLSNGCLNPTHSAPVQAQQRQKPAHLLSHLEANPSADVGIPCCAVHRGVGTAAWWSTWWSLVLLLRRVFKAVVNRSKKTQLSRTGCGRPRDPSRTATDREPRCLANASPGNADQRTEGTPSAGRDAARRSPFH